VAEAVALLAWLRQEMAGPVGLVGVSLGALVAALLLGGGAQPDYAILALTPADVAGAVAQAPLLRRLREELGGNGLSMEERDSWARLVRPMEMPLVMPRQRLLLLHGRDDAIAPPGGVQALWEAWGRPEMAWYNGGHFSILLRMGWVLSQCRGFLRRAMERRVSSPAPSPLPAERTLLPLEGESSREPPQQAQNRPAGDQDERGVADPPSQVPE